MNELRTQALQRRRALDSAKRITASKAICDRVIASPEFRAAARIACYLPMPDEVDTRAIIERAWCANKRVFVPVTRQSGDMTFRDIRPDTTLRKNRHAIWEPEDGDFISPRRLQLVVTPTVVFDEENHRVGMGGGYYDRCFRFLRHRKRWFQPKLIGVAFACQKVEKIRPNPWDIRLYRTISA